MGKDRLRIATREDAPALLVLIQESFQEVKDYGIDWPSTNATLESVIENIETGVAIVLEREGQLLATITIRLPWETDTPISHYPFLWWFATAHAWKGQGIGKKFLKQVEEEFLIKQFKAPAYVIGTSGEKHPWLLDMYLRNGYQTLFTQRDENDLGVALYKVLIPERFDEKILRVAEAH
ncbi:GNAT family N-acetyltransferase [Candidatus Enterococcus willemsii]|uniref:Acetyltransferase n=1 Tax=Candidatus Enterococcus willemsii TaxID=1857215 RepID=A0ABQ6YZK3_9ENTE|nr:GNAT family N-acetyltransferase [Enterococcus sp. CU12B]KAF1304049.1 acetyltransferase [Enterococcus sp. CU12B]